MNKTHLKKSTLLQRNIMRRVYYTFVVRTILRPVFIHTGVLAVSFFLLTRVVSVPDVWRNLMGVEVGNVLNYIFSALVNTTSVTLVLLAIIGVTTISILWRLLFGHRTWGMEGESWA